MQKSKSLFIVMVSGLLLNLAACSTAQMSLDDELSGDTSVSGVDSVGAGTDVSSGADANTSTDNGPKPCVDKDKDGYCDASPQPGDCNDDDPNVNPGMAEKCGDNVDNNCNGQIDEGCAVPTPTSNATIKVTYADGHTRTLNVQVWSDKAQLGQWWDKSVTNANTTLVADLGEVYSTDCGLRFNVTEGGSNWLCMGNGSTAQLNTSAAVSVLWNGVTYTNSDLSTWSAPGGTAQGCSALLRVKKTGICAL